MKVKKDKRSGDCMESGACKAPIIVFSVGQFEVRLCRKHSRELRNALSEAEAEAARLETP